MNINPLPHDVLSQADDFELFTRIRGQFTLTRLSPGVYDCPADFSEMTVMRLQPRGFQTASVQQSFAHSQGGVKNAGTPSRTASHRTYRLVARGGIGCERRYPFDRESGAGCRGGAWDSQQRVGRGGRRPGRWGYVDGCG